MPGTSTQQYVQPGQTVCTPSSPCNHISASTQSTHHCQVPCSQHHQSISNVHQTQQQQQQQPTSHQVQAATQTPQTAPVTSDIKKQQKANVQDSGKKKGRLLYRHPNQQSQQGAQLPPNQNYQLDANACKLKCWVVTQILHEFSAGLSRSSVISRLQHIEK